MQRLIWMVFLGGLVAAGLLGGSETRLLYRVAAAVVLAVVRRPLVLALTKLASRYGMMKETVQRMPDAIRLLRAPSAAPSAQPILTALAACNFVDAGAWHIMELPKIEVSLMVQPDEGMLAAVES